MQFNICVAINNHLKYAESISLMIDETSKIKGTGIAKRKPEYIKQKIKEEKAVIALNKDTVVGFCYIESWENHKYVANSGLIVHSNYRKTGLARAIKKEIFELSKEKFPDSKLFGITTSMAVMKINSELGYTPVTYSELTKDEDFWKGCQSCMNYDILQRTNKSMCYCTAMVCSLATVNVAKSNKKKAWENFTLFLKQRKVRVKQISKEFPKLFKTINNE